MIKVVTWTALPLNDSNTEVFSLHTINLAEIIKNNLVFVPD